MRVLTLWYPNWPVIAAGVSPQTPAMVLHANRVVASSPAATVEGVTTGQRRRIAQRCCPEALVLGHDPDRDMLAFEPVVAEVGRFVPRLEVGEAGCISFDARGPSRYFGGEESFMIRLLESVSTVMTIPPRLAIADGRFTANVAAQSSQKSPHLIPPGESARFLAPLEVEWLNLAGSIDADLIDLFRRLGLRRLGDIASLSPSDVNSRFGRSGARARQLAAGGDDDPLDLSEPRQAEVVEQRLDTPVETAQPLIFVVKHLADELAFRLAESGLVCTRVVVIAETDHAEVSERSWYRATGLSPADMVDRGRWQLEAWVDSGATTAGVVLIRLVAAETRADYGESQKLWGGPTNVDQRAARAATRLVGLVGDGSVKVPTWSGGQLHQQRWQWTSVAAVDLTDIDRARARVQPGTAEGPWPGTIPPPAPMHVPEIPKIAELRDVEDLPVIVNARGELASEPSTIIVGDSAPETVLEWAGPWPLHTRWWDPSRRRRAARLQIVTGSGTAHVLMVEDRQWHVIGTYT